MQAFFRTVYGIYALVIFLVAALITAIPLSLVPGESRRRAIGKAALRIAFRLAGVRIQTTGLEHLPNEPAICVCNHASQLDGLLLFALLPTRYTFVVRIESKRTPIFGYLLDRVGVIWMDRASARSGSRTIRLLIRQLQAGRSVAMFPEGTIRPESGLLPFKLGAFSLAGMANVPIVPAVLHGTRILFPDRAKVPTAHPVRISLHAPMGAEGSTRDDARALMQSVRTLILNECGEPDTVTEA